MFAQIYKLLKIYHNIYFKNKYFYKKHSYSTNGEDLKILNFFRNKKKGFYVDVGSFHPLRMNNTYLLYKKNWTGINIDPSKFSIELFNFLRPKDLNYSCAISNQNKKLDFYYKKDHYPLNSLVKSVLNKTVVGSLKRKRVQAYTLNKILSKSRFKNCQIDLLDIDVEGAELNVLKGLSFKMYKPKLICIEIHQKNFKKNKVYLFLIKKKYRLIWYRSVSFIFEKL